MAAGKTPTSPSSWAAFLWCSNEARTHALLNGSPAINSVTWADFSALRDGTVGRVRWKLASAFVVTLDAPAGEILEIHQGRAMVVRTSGPIQFIGALADGFGGPG